MTARKPNFISRFWRSLGPGLIAGAADDDPSGIATYSIAGAQLGTSLVWTAVITWPLMAAVQMMCARIGAATVWLSYKKIANTLKWLALFLFGYVVTAFMVHPNWGQILRDTVVPHVPSGKQGWGTVVAILGTTISPYLFFWQASQEVEEEKSIGRSTTIARRGATPQEINVRRLDVGVGTFVSNIVMFFIIVTTALTLHRHGITNIETSRQAAEALMPLAGRGCFLLYTAGVIGVGLLAIPTLSGSAAYALAETFGWKQGLDEKLEKARAFYAVVLLSVAVAIAIDFASINP